MGPLRKLSLGKKLYFLIKGISRQILGYKTKLAGLALREYYEEIGLFQHETSLVNIPPGLDRLRLKGKVWVGAFSMIWVGDDPKGKEFEGKIRFGSNIYIGDHCNLRAAGGVVEIGDNVLVANGVTMVATNHGMNPGTPMIDQVWSDEPKGILIGSDVWVGAHAVLLPGCRIGNGAIVAAGAVVRGVVPENAIMGGIPAKVIRLRTE